MKYFLDGSLFNTVFDNLMAELKTLNRNKKYTVEIKEVKKKRTLPQNSYYWVIVGIISDNTGYTPDELHEGFKRNFIGVYHGFDIFDNPVIRAKSSTDLSTKDFNDYIDKVAAFALSKELEIPPPQHYGYTEREKQ